MILYFSGTGNSKYVAESVAKELGDKICPIASEDSHPILAKALDNNTPFIGFVFPVYSWGVPPIVMDFINSISDDDARRIIDKNTPVWMIATCGDETGDAHLMFQKAFRHKGIEVKGMWSVIMPNTYVLLPGFDVDSDNVRIEKLKQAPARIKDISGHISKSQWECDVTKGKWSKLKTSLVYPLFKRWGIFPKKWKSTAGCIGCGKCQKACPVANINMINNKPSWGQNCTSCLACYHVCPFHAIEYGTITNKKGQYSFGRQ